MSSEEELKRKYLKDNKSFVDLVKSQETTVKKDTKSFVDTIKNPEEDEDSDQNFIKKDDPFTNVTQSQEVQEVVNRLKNAIAPKNNKRRDLDLEVGGLEVDTSQEEKSAEDIWDERGEQVDDMVVDVYNTTSMKSLVWKKKKSRLDIKKELSEESLTMSEKEIAKRMEKLRDNPGPGRGR